MSDSKSALSSGQWWETRGEELAFVTGCAPEEENTGTWWTAVIERRSGGGEMQVIMFDGDGRCLYLPHRDDLVKLLPDCSGWGWFPMVDGEWKIIQ
jgi:hypothetical protein